MALLNKKTILEADDLKTEIVTVPEWGGDVIVRTLTGKERDAFETSMINQRGKSREMNFQNLRARLLVLTMVDENGKRMFSDLEVDELGRKSAAALDRVYDVAQRLSGLRKEDIDELTKNSENPPKEESGSDLQPRGDVQ